MKIPVRTRDRLRAAAAAEHTTQAALIARLLAEHEAAVFWEAMAAIDPEEYAAATLADGIAGGKDYVLEDAMLDAAESD